MKDRILEGPRANKKVKYTTKKGRKKKIKPLIPKGYKVIDEKTGQIGKKK